MNLNRMYLPFVALYCWVDVLFQELLRLQFMYTKHSQKLLNLLALQWLQAAQKQGFNYTYILVQRCKTFCVKATKRGILLYRAVQSLNT